MFNGAALCQCAMMKSKTFVALALVIGSLAVNPAMARRGDQDEALQARRDGEVRSLREIENRIVPGMKAKGAAYIGQEFDGQQSRYRLKFLRGSSVIWVDVDGRSGAILGKAGN
jgi:hypothetical protein